MAFAKLVLYQVNTLRYLLRCITFINRLNTMLRKNFGDLSKSQKNRRLKRVYQQQLPGEISCQGKPVNEQGNRSVDGVNDCPINHDLIANNLNPSNDCNNDKSLRHIASNSKTNNNLNCPAMNAGDVLSTKSKIGIQQELARWQCQYNISQAACGALLGTLRNVESLEDLKQLPKDPRTLLITPKVTNIRIVSPGEYFHYGLERGLTDQLRSIGTCNFSSNISINVHIDGLPISKSSKRQLYPILAEVFPKIARPFVIGVYHGLSKPDKCDEFLEEFILEYKNLNSTGFEYNQRQFTVTIRAVICDSPARAFVTHTKGHNGYYGCGKCVQEGDYANHRMRFLEIEAPLRSDDSFRNRLNEEHHLGQSIFEETEVGMVSQFPVEYMHLVCLGVVKKFINLWIKGWRFDTTFLKFNHAKIKDISAQLNTIRTWIPREFARKTRELGEVDRWKATELRLFLLYVGPVVFKGHLSSFT